MISINDLFFILLLNSITGGIAYFLWHIWKCCMEKRVRLKYIYPMLGVVIFFFLIPILYIHLKLQRVVWGEEIAFSGVLFTKTPFIYRLQWIISVIWILGVLFNFGKYINDYRKFRHMIKGSFAYTDADSRKEEIQQELALHQNVVIVQSYSITAPIIVGCRKKRIILPVKSYSERELETILYHELVHVKQKILFLKKLGIFLKLLFWCNPVMNCILRSLDEWGETACDIYVCNETNYPFSQKEYFETAVDELEEINMWVPQMITGFRKKNSMKGRILRMKNYKKEKDLKKAGGVIVTALLCICCTTTVFAAGAGFSNAYEAVYENTKVEIEVEPIIQEYTEYVEEFIPEEHTIMIDEITMYSGSGNFDWQVPARTMYQTSEFSMTKGQTVSVAVIIAPQDKTVRVGIIRPDGKTVYVNGSGLVSYEFKAAVEGEYKVYVENTNSTSVSANGVYATN